MKRTKEEIEKIVIFIRLRLYNHGLPCSAKAIRSKMEEELYSYNVPSISTISTILRKNGLTYMRTGFY